MFQIVLYGQLIIRLEVLLAVGLYPPLNAFSSPTDRRYHNSSAHIRAFIQNWIPTKSKQGTKYAIQNTRTITEHEQT